VHDRLGPLADRLEAINEELDEMMFDLLREASAAGATERPRADTQLSRARRSIDKAAHLLRQLDEEG
jgi:hypothetical protein